MKQASEGHDQATSRPYGRRDLPRWQCHAMHPRRVACLMDTTLRRHLRELVTKEWKRYNFWLSSCATCQEWSVCKNATVARARRASTMHHAKGTPNRPVSILRLSSITMDPVSQTARWRLVTSHPHSLSRSGQWALDLVQCDGGPEWTKLQHMPIHDATLLEYIYIY